ncbi:MAG: protein kinase [Alphaproteobacteria bacterium]|nr:protein kinase [Alphaproteobacteria bacterium]MCB9699586.1 protein kinase [Alphaproteobacteria bacterium]
MSTANPAPPRSPDLVGRPLIANRFALFAKIAEGGMAGVYRAWDQQLRAWRAIKVLLPEYAQRPNLRSRFESEARALAAIDHQNVVRVYDIAADAILPYIVMELAEGGTLNDWLDRYGQMPARMAVEVTLQVARGLGAAHAVGVVHRDVKPQNVLLDARGRCLVTDFGIARVTFGDHLTRTGSSMGTVGYMAPEQRADAKLVDARADVYGVGAMLYKLLTGVVLTDLFLVEHDPKLLAPVPQAIRPVVLQACRHDRALRFQDTTELVSALEGVLELLPRLPDDIPKLGTPPDDVSMDRSSQDYSAITPLLDGMSGPGGSTSPAAARSASPETRTPAHIPYRMPERPAMRPETPVPLASPISVERRKTEGSPSLPTMDSPHPSAEARTPTLRIGLLAALLIVVSSWFLGMLTGAWSLRGDQELEAGARAELYEVLGREAELLPELVERGADRDAVAELGEVYRQWELSQDPRIRLELADHYATGTLALSAGMLGESGTDMTSMRARNLSRAHDAWRRTRNTWEADANGIFGRSAIRFGFGPAPD